jgi:hypothetical protein
MDLEQLNKIDTSNPDQVKALQTFLKTRGYYNGPIDGKWGGGTTTGTVKLREELTTAANTARDTETAKTEGIKAANDPTARLTKMATEFGPWAVGVGAGIGTGIGVAKKFNKEDKLQSEAASRLAKAKDITPQAGREGLARMDSRRAWRSGKQFLGPAAFGGAGAFTSEVVAPRFNDDPETKKYINLAATTENAAGAGLASKQMLDLALRGDPIDQEDRARIMSRSAPPPAATPDAPVLRTPADRLTAAARAAGASGKLTKKTAAEYLATNVNAENRAAVATELGVGPGQKITSAIKKLSTSRKPSVLIGPMIAAGMGYDAASSEAEAAGATPAEARTRGAVAGTGAAALTGGAMYGLSKLPQMMGRAAGTGMSMLAPFAAADMYDPTPEELSRDRNAVARKFPRFLHGGAVEDAYQMAQTPEPSPVRSQLSGFAAERAGPLSSASALQVPEGIPLPRPDGASPYAEAQPARAASGDERFDTALKEWLGLIQEHNSSIGGQPPNFQQAPAVIGAR